MCPYATTIGEKNTYFIAHHYRFIENDKVQEGTLLNATNKNLDPFLYHLGKCGVNSVEKLDCSQIHCCWPRDEEDENDDLVEEDEDIDSVEEDENVVETNYCNGTDEVVKIFNQKYVLRFERDSVYEFRQCGHQCICEQCHQNKGDIDILKCVVCRT